MVDCARDSKIEVFLPGRTEPVDLSTYAALLSAGETGCDQIPEQLYLDLAKRAGEAETTSNA